MSIGVKRHHHITARLGKASVKCCGFSAIGDADQPDARIASKMLLHDLWRAVPRSVIDDDDLESGIVTRENLLDRLNDNLRFVVRRYQDGLKRRIGRAGGGHAG